MNALDLETPHAAALDLDDEAGLLERLRAPAPANEAAFDELVRATSGQLYAVARRMLGNDDDAFDAVQDTFLNAFKKLAGFDGRSQIRTWLHSITINTCLMKLRSRRRRPERSIEDFLPTFLDDGHQTTPSRSWNPNGPGGIEERELHELVQAKLAELPDAFRTVLLLRDVEGLSTEEAAEALGLSVSALKTRLHRARQALRGLLDPHMEQGAKHL